MRWKLILEQYNPDLIHIQGSKNIATGVLSILDIVDTNNLIGPNISSQARQFSLEKEYMLHSVNFKNIMQFQEIDKALIQTAKSNKEDSIQLWRGEKILSNL